MALKKRNFEKAVSCLLSPHNYEYMLFIQSQIKQNPHRPLSPKFAKSQDIIRLVQAGSPTPILSDTGDAVRVLREAVKRLK